MAGLAARTHPAPRTLAWPHTIQGTVTGGTRSPTPSADSRPSTLHPRHWASGHLGDAAALAQCATRAGDRGGALRARGRAGDLGNGLQSASYPLFWQGRWKIANEGILPGPSWCSGAATARGAFGHESRSLPTLTTSCRPCQNLQTALFATLPQPAGLCLYPPPPPRTHTGLRPSVFPPAWLGAPHHCGCCE